MRTIELPDLDLEETVEAIRQGQLKKFFHERNKDHWAALESPKGKTKMVAYQQAEQASSESKAQTHQVDSQSST